MKQVCLVLFLLSATYQTSADNVIRGVVTDSLGNGLPFVNAGIAGKTYGTVTGSDGTFMIILESNSIAPDDSLRFSMIGYKSCSMPVAPYLKCDSSEIRIVLHPETYALREVAVVAPGLVRKTEGNTNTTTTMSNNMAISGLPGQNLGAEVGRKFFLKGKMHHIDKLNFYIRYCNFDTVVFRVNVYETENGKPSRKLVIENMIFTLVKHRKGWASFDLSKWHISTDQNVVVSLEWVGHSVKGNLLGFPITVPSPGAVHYYKFGSQAEWKRYVSMSTAMNIEVLTEP
jgi:hypothetical protein